MTETRCPCQSGRTYEACCLRIHNWEQSIVIPEQLMRSRYTAFVKKNVDYLIATHHPATRESNLRNHLQNSVDHTEWLGLHIIRAATLHPDVKEAYVEFVVFYKADGIQQLHENSRFIYDEGRWYYVDGEFLPPIKLKKNNPCFCGSGKKYKDCHK